MFNACKTNADVALWQEAERTARVAVTRVFVSETRNSPDKADIIGLEFVRTILGKWQRGEIRE